MIKKALTTIELIFIVILIGIMSAVATSYFRDDKLALAAYQVLEHIRYTQHLALSEHKFDPKDVEFKSTPGYLASREGMYYRGWWQIRFQSIAPTNAANGLIGYSIYSDFDRQGGIDVTNVVNPAINPLDNKWFRLYDNCPNCSEDVFLDKKYDITNITFSATCQDNGFRAAALASTAGVIVFDEKGRPYYGIANNAQNNPYQFLLTANCIITLTGAGGKVAEITIYPETGYAEITRLD